MFEFKVRSESRTRRPDEKGLLYYTTVLDVVRRGGEGEGEGEGVQRGWTVTDTEVRHDQPTSACWNLVHTTVRRPDGTVAYDGAGLQDRDALVQVLRAEMS